MSHYLGGEFMVKIFITNNNDILYNSLSNIFWQNELNIEVTKVEQSNLSKLLYKLGTKETIIILEANTSIIFCLNLFKNVIEQVDIRKTNIIILVVDSNSIPNITEKQYHHFFKNRNLKISLTDIMSVVSYTLKDSINIIKSIDDIFWELGFTNYFKGSIYLKDAIYLAYNDKKLLLDTNILVKKVSEKNKIKNEKIVRSAMDKSLNSMLNYIDEKIIYDIFGTNYDGRKISLKYFIDLCIRYLETKDIAV